MKIDNYNYYLKGENTLKKMLVDFLKYHNKFKPDLKNQFKTEIK